MKIKDADKAFTLTELLISLAILSYILMGFAHIFIYNNRALNNSKMYTLAQRWAADTIEEYKSKYYFSVATGTWVSGPEILGANTEFLREVVITEEPDNPGLKEIVVTVSWSDMNTPLELSLVSYIADY